MCDRYWKGIETLKQQDRLYPNRNGSSISLGTLACWARTDFQKSNLIRFGDLSPLAYFKEPHLLSRVVSRLEVPSFLADFLPRIGESYCSERDLCLFQWVTISWLT
jgi:hypothetical protein